MYRLLRGIARGDIHNKQGQYRLLFNGSIVVDLYKVAVRIFEVDLLHAIYTNRWFFLSARPVRILYLVFVEIDNEGIDVLYTKAKVVVPVSFILFLAAFNKVQVPCFPNREPGVLSIVKWLRNLLEAENIFIERRACLEVSYIHAYMVE